MHLSFLFNDGAKGKTPDMFFSLAVYLHLPANTNNAKKNLCSLRLNTGGALKMSSLPASGCIETAAGYMVFMGCDIPENHVFIASCAENGEESAHFQNLYHQIIIKNPECILWIAYNYLCKI